MEGSKRTRIGIYGGTFNPPHLGHIRAARAAMRHLELNQIIVVPTNLPPHKPLPEGTPAPKERLRMTRLAFEAIPQARIVDLELRRRGVSYTADTVATLQNLYPVAEMYLILGTDMFMSFRKWSRPEEIIKVCKLAFFARESAADMHAVIREARMLMLEYGAEISVIPNAAVEVSSTEIRDRLLRGDDPILLPTSVAAYIEENGLYRREEPDDEE